MNFLIAWNFIKSVGWIFARFAGKTPPDAPERIGIAPKIVAASIVLIAVIACGIFVKNCCIRQRVERTADEVQTQKTAVMESESVGEVLEERQKEIKSENEELRKEYIQTNANYGNAVRRDSAARDGNFSTVKKRWCQNHASDSKCRK